MIAPSLNLVIAQRLVRRICPHCATKKMADYSERAEIEEALRKIQDANPGMDIQFD
ncbi:hypothetical protein J5751_06755 [bacterium]|nr:hypothetical protein [bacterium]